MLQSFLLTVLVTTTLAASPCCIDRQFEAQMGELGGVLYSAQGKPAATLLNVDTILHVDYYSRMMAIESTSHLNGTSVKSDMVIDMKTGYMYITTNGGNCQKMLNTYNSPFIEPCIPADAKLIGSSYLGYGANEVPFTTWQFTVTTNSMNQTVRLSVTDHGCIPVTESTFGTVAKSSSEIIFILTNFHPGIRKQSVFTIPKHCTDGPQDVPEHLRSVVNAAKRIVTFR